VREERDELLPGHQGDGGLGVPLPQGAQERREEEKVADRAETDEEDGGRHGVKVRCVN
jgi:hypothetical protein